MFSVLVELEEVVFFVAFFTASAPLSLSGDQLTATTQSEAPKVLSAGIFFCAILENLAPFNAPVALKKQIPVLDHQQSVCLAHLFQ